MFISTSEIGHLTSCYLCMTWLNWSLNLHTRLWTNSYLIPIQHTSLIFNECLFHLCNCACLNVMCVYSYIWIKPKRFLIILFVFGSVFRHSLFLSFVLTLFFNVSSLFLCWKIRVRVFHESFATWLRVAKLKNAFLAVFGHQAVAFASWPLAKCLDQLFHGYFVSFWSKTPHMTLLWLHLLQTLFFKASTSKPN